MKNPWCKSLIFLLILFISISCNKEDECIENRKEDCFCNEIYMPVCGCNGVSYGNPCSAECAGITDYTVGTCD